jgi:DNA polymerase-3 subunit chi
VPALFYHLTRSTDEALLGQILPRALAQGWRVFVRGTDAAGLARLDAALWTDPADSFLPHGLSGGPDDARQPVLLGTGQPANGAVAMVLVQGAVASADEAAGLHRLWVVFDGQDEAAVSGARALWRDLAAGGIGLEYWSEAGGRWQKTAERPPADAGSGP